MKPHLQTTIWTLLQANASQREIERVTGISRQTIRAYQHRFAAQQANCPGVATGSEAVATQIPPPWPPAPGPVATPTTTITPPAVSSSLCQPWRSFIEAQLRLKRNATAIYQDLVDLHGFAGAYNSVKRFVGKLREKEPEQFDRLSFLPAEVLQAIVHRRYKLRRAVVITSNRVIQDWGKYLGDATMASTILDRLMHRCAMLEFEGKSYRLKEAAARIAINPEPS